MSSRVRSIGSIQLLEIRRLLSVATADVGLLQCSAASATAFPTAALVKDIRAGKESSSPHAMQSLGNKLYFAARDASHGDELWQSNGTAAGTKLVKDIRSGSTGSSPYSLTRIGDTMFFVANDGVHGNELWKTNGTRSGTMLVKDIRSGGKSASPRQLTVVDSTLYFTADDGKHGRSLWKSNGTSSGTMLVKQIVADRLTCVGSKLFFVSNYDVWRRDSTGTSKVWSPMFKPSGDYSVDLDLLTATGTDLYFSGSYYGPEVRTDHQIWKTNGSTSGTKLVKELDQSLYTHPRQAVAAGSTVFFVADAEGHDELWKSNGTSSGTSRVGQLSFDSIENLSGLNGKGYFTSSVSAGQPKLWKTDGTPKGTTALATLDYEVLSFRQTGGKLCFATRLGGHEETGIWISDGTTAGTQSVRRVLQSSYGFASEFKAVGETIFFSGTDGDYYGTLHGYELWKITASD